MSKKHSCIIPLFITLLTLSGLTLATATTVPVWIFAGQSNMDGSASRLEEAELLDALAQSEITKCYLPRTKEWVNIGVSGKAYRRHRGRDLYGPEIGFSKEMEETGKYPKIRIIKHAIGNTSLKNHWKANNGQRYIELIEIVKEATAEGGPYELKGLFWLQGENDAPWAAADEYEANFIAFIDAIREDLDAPELPIIVARIATPIAPGKITGTRKVQAAQLAAVEARPPAAYFDIMDIPLREDQLHYRQDQFSEIGRRFARTYLENFSNNQ